MVSNEGNQSAAAVLPRQRPRGIHLQARAQLILHGHMAHPSQACPAFWQNSCSRTAPACTCTAVCTFNSGISHCTALLGASCPLLWFLPRSTHGAMHLPHNRPSESKLDALPGVQGPSQCGGAGAAVWLVRPCLERECVLHAYSAAAFCLLTHQGLGVARLLPGTCLLGLQRLAAHRAACRHKLRWVQHRSVAAVPDGVAALT